MDIKITYTCINTYSYSTSKCVRTCHYDVCHENAIEDALKRLKKCEPEGLKIQKIEVINQ